jgi:hypothetical protein
MRGEIRKWTVSEVEYLKANYGEMSAEQIGIALGRTKLSVHTMRKRLRLNMTKQQAGREISRKHPRLTGDKSPGWRGGVSKDNTRYTKRFRARHPEKARAHDKVKHALRMGYIARTACVVCGNPKSEGHHERYDKPLEVIWLCRTHHIEADRARRERIASAVTPEGEVA